MAQGKDFGLYVPTTNVWDTSQIQNLNDAGPQLKELLIRLYQNLNRMSLALNQKESAFYPTQEFVTGATWFPNPSASTPAQQRSINRPERRTVINFGALPAAGFTSKPHGITCTTSTSITGLEAFATKPTAAFSYIPIPYVSAAGGTEIELSMDATNVTITVASDRSAYTTCYVIISYLQS